MRRLRALLLRLGGLFHKDRRDRDLAEEIESHLQLHLEDNLRAGMSPEDARRQALLKLGGIESTKEAYRDRRSVPVLECVRQDLRYAFRMLRKSPGFTGVAVVTLAFGIGATTAVFSVLDTAVLRPMPVRHPEGLVILRPQLRGERFGFWRARVAAGRNWALRYACLCGRAPYP
jgi:macrolide transport system ATP-binding/permease protein